MKISRFLAVIVLSWHSLQAESISFFAPRSVTTNSAFELALVNYDRYHSSNDQDDAWVQFYWKPFFMKSNNGNCLARYFLPHNKACVSLDESGAGDIDPLWFSLISPDGTFYTSTVCLCPTRKAYGALFDLYINVADCWWLGLTTTAMKVEHNLHVRELDRKYEGTIPGFQNACEAFNNPLWNAGKLPCSKRCQSGVDDVQLKLGYDFYTTDESHATLYVVGTVPTGKHVTSSVLFEPLVGSRHGSFGVGLDVDYAVCGCDEYAFNLLGDLKYRYVFSAQERRSFDLTQNGDWSRYLLVVTEAEPLDSMPAINLLTLKSEVTPGSTVDFWLAAHYARCNWHLEVGYDVWWRQAEKICLGSCGIAPGYGIQTLNVCPEGATTASTANISQSVRGPNGVVNDPSFVPLTTQDLNLCSAAHPAAHSQTVYGAVAYDASLCGYHMMVGGGASYEFDAHNALRQWTVWFAQGFEF